MSFRVLIVDDCSVVRHFIKLTLVSEPEIDTIFEAGSAEEIWRLIDKEAIDVITLDMNMPGIDGLQIIKRLKALSLSDIIVVSGNTDSHAQAMRMGAVACFEKDRLMPDRAQFIDSVISNGSKPHC